MYLLRSLLAKGRLRHAVFAATILLLITTLVAWATTINPIAYATRILKNSGDVSYTAEQVRGLVEANAPMTMYHRPSCPWCVRQKNAFEALNTTASRWDFNDYVTMKNTEADTSNAPEMMSTFGNCMADNPLNISKCMQAIDDVSEEPDPFLANVSAVPAFKLNTIDEPVVGVLFLMNDDETFDVKNSAFRGR